MNITNTSAPLGAPQSPATGLAGEAGAPSITLRPVVLYGAKGWRTTPVGTGFGSDASLRWFVGRNFSRLTAAGALVMLSGRWCALEPNFSALVIAIGREQARLQAACAADRSQAIVEAEWRRRQDDQQVAALAAELSPSSTAAAVAA